MNTDPSGHFTIRRNNGVGGSVGGGGDDFYERFHINQFYTFEYFKWNKIHSNKTKLGLFIPM